MPPSVKRPVAQWYCAALPAVTVFLLSHFSGYIIPTGRPVTFELAVLTTPVSLISNIVFNAHPEWTAVYQHVTVRPGFLHNGMLLIIYFIQAAVALRWIRS